MLTFERQDLRERKGWGATKSVKRREVFHPDGLVSGHKDQACVSQKTRKLLGPVDFSGLFSGEFLGSRKAFLNAPENTPDSHPSFSGCFLGFAARA